MAWWGSNVYVEQVLEGRAEAWQERNLAMYRCKTEAWEYIMGDVMKEEGEPFEVKWNLLSRPRPYVCGTRKCDLCIT